MLHEKSVPGIGPKSVLKHGVVQNAKEIGSIVARPLGGGQGGALTFQKKNSLSGIYSTKHIAAAPLAGGVMLL